MEALFANGRIVDLVIGITLLEGLALMAYHRVTGKGIAPLDLLGTLLAGLFLMLALRAGLAQASWLLVAICLCGALVAHVLDLVRRWRA